MSSCLGCNVPEPWWQEAGCAASRAAFSESSRLKGEALGRQSWPTAFLSQGESIRQMNNFLKLFSVSPD